LPSRNRLTRLAHGLKGVGVASIVGVHSVDGIDIDTPGPGPASASAAPSALTSAPASPSALASPAAPPSLPVVPSAPASSGAVAASAVGTPASKPASGPGGGAELLSPKQPLLAHAAAKTLAARVSRSVLRRSRSGCT
jgi:hypothetical protein